MKNIINLEKFRTPRAKIFTGRDRGEQVRKESKIDEIEAKFENIEFIVPANLVKKNFIQNLLLKMKEHTIMKNH